MKFTAQRHFDGVPPQDVLALMCDEEFQREKAERLGARGFSFAVSRRQGGDVTVVTKRSISRTRLPEFVKTHVLGTLRVVETERWASDGGVPTRAAFEVQVQGAPVRMIEGVAALDADDTGTTLSFSGVVESTTPFFRAQIAQAGAATLLETINLELGLLQERFASSPTESPRPPSRA